MGSIAKLFTLKHPFSPNSVPIQFALPVHCFNPNTTMIIQARHLTKYFNSIKFPIDVFEDKSERIAHPSASRADLLVMIQREEVFATATRKRIKKIRKHEVRDRDTVLRVRVLSGPPTATQIHYKDSLSGCSPIFCVKRATGQMKDGQKEYEEWDNGLTFAELRRDPARLVSQATQDKRSAEREALRFQQHPISSSASR